MKITKAVKVILFLIISTVLLFGCVNTHEKQQKFEYPPMTGETFDDIMFPSYVPDGYTVTDMSISPLFNTIEYTYGENILYFTQGHNDATVSFDNEHNTISEYQSDKYEGILLTSTDFDNNYLLYVWDDQYSYELSGTIDKNELFKMIESIELYATSSE